MTTRGQAIPYFKPGGHRTVLSATAANAILRVFNAVLNLRVVRGGCNTVQISDSNMVIQIRR